MDYSYTAQHPPKTRDNSTTHFSNIRTLTLIASIHIDIYTYLLNYYFIFINISTFVRQQKWLDIITKEVSRLNDVCYANKHKFTKLATNFVLEAKQIKPQEKIIKKYAKNRNIATVTHTHTTIPA